ALAWLRAQGGVIPILGARTADQLADNLTCLDVTLPPEALARLGQASHVARGFPHDFLASADYTSAACPPSSTSRRAGPGTADDPGHILRPAPGSGCARA